MWVERNGSTWRIRDEVGDKKIDLEAGHPTKSSAQAAMVLLKADKLRGDSLVPGSGRLTLNAFIDEWWPGYKASLKQSSVHSEGARIANHIRPLLGNLTLNELDTTVIQQWVGDLGKGVGEWPARGKRRPLAPKTVHNCHGLLFVILKAAIAAKRGIRINPCGATNLPARVHREMRFLTDPEIVRLVKAMPAHWRPLIILLIGTGLRWGEAIGLKVGRVNLTAKRPHLRVEEQLQEMPGRGSKQIFTSPKSVRSRRTVSFTRQIALVLAPLVADKEADEMVFLTTTGLMVRTRNFRRNWKTATKKAGLEGLRIHDLRHTHAAILIAAGRQMMAISRRLGHASTNVTDVIYGHLREEVDEGILDAIDAALVGVDEGREPVADSAAGAVAELLELVDDDLEDDEADVPDVEGLDLEAEVEDELSDPL